MNKIKEFLKKFYSEIKGVVSFQNKIQTNLVLSVLAFYFFIWTLKMAINKQITINNWYELIFYSENFLLVIILLFFNNAYKIYCENKDNINKAVIKVAENKLNVDLNEDGKI